MYAKILVPVDGGPASTAALRVAGALAKLAGARLRLVHVADRFAHASGFEPAAVYCEQVLPRVQRQARALLESARRCVEGTGVEVETLLVEPEIVDIPDALCTAATVWGADLIVVGTHGRRGVDRFLLGSHAECLVRQASVPVLVVRAQEGDDASGAVHATTPA